MGGSWIKWGVNEQSGGRRSWSEEEGMRARSSLGKEVSGTGGGGRRQ